MIASLKGIVLSKRPEGIIVDVNGVGYHVNIPLCSLADIPESGEMLFLHTYTHVREDSLQLFGFLTEEEKRIFSVLLGISGIGPKLGLAVLSGMSVEKFSEAVQNEDIATLSSIPGLGKKTAARLILELRGKLPALGERDGAAKTGISAAGDAVSALVNLGYRKGDSEKAVQNAVKAGYEPVEEIIREALKYLTEKK